MSALRGYRPDEGSTAWKVIQFLTTNPTESLSANDVEAKFGKSAKQVHSLLGAAISSGVLKRVEDLDSGELLYSLGSGHPEVRANAARAPSLGTRASAALDTASLGTAKPKRSVRLVLDVSTIALADDIPLPPRVNTSTDWPALFDRMAPGHSAGLPIAVKATLLKAITTYQQAHPDVELATRAVSPDSIRVWRVK